MAATQVISAQKVVRDVKSGRLVTVRGAGALKGHLTLNSKVDLTKPIASQAMKGPKVRKVLSTTAKR